MTALSVEHLEKTYFPQGGDPVRALGDISFSVQRGELVCIVGPSGAGKTTLLKCLSGLMRPTGGSILVNSHAVSGPPSEMALVFQDYSRSLYPWMRVTDNVEFPLLGKVPPAERKLRVAESLEAVGLAGAGRQYPWQLSGGMQQRVAIARAIAYRPDVLLMDEPFASVDAQTRADLEDLVLRIRDEFDMTIVFVTHDIDESVYLADRVVVLTNRPTTVHEELPIPLPRPRDQVMTKEMPDFAHLRAHVYSVIKGLAPAQHS